MTTSVELDGVSAAWEFDNLQTADDNGDRTSGTVVAQSTEPAAVPADGAPAGSGEPVPVDVGSGSPAQPATPGSAPAADAPSVYTADASNVVRLPANISIENIRVEGSDLVLEQADGTLITVKDAAANVPTFVIGEVEVPRVALLAALEASGVDVAFGADGSIAVSPGQPSSSGGNFEVPPGGIGDGFDLSDLLPPTALAFPRYEGRELYPSLVEQEENNLPPTIIIPVTVTPFGFNTQVFEAGLNSSGSNAASDSEITSGTFQLADGNGLSDLVSMTVNGTTVLIGDLAGSTFTGAYGILKITSYDVATGAGTYEYKLTAAMTDVDGLAERDVFTVTVSDGALTSAPVEYDVEIFDDVPNAVNDGAYVVVEDGAGALNTPPTSLVSGNVLTNDVHPNGLPGADTPTSFVAWGAGDAAVIAQLSTYGTLVQNANGTWSYTLNNGLAATQALDSTFSQNFVLNYTMQDADGDQDTATLTITINGANDGPTVTVNQGNGGANDQVLEAGLNGSGSAAAGNGEFAGGTFTLADADGLADLQSVTITGVGAPVVFTIAQLTGATPGLPLTVLGDHGTLRITGYAAGVATYTYELTEATTDLAGIEQDSFTVTVTDGTTTSAPAAITIDIIDDVPNAVNDGAYVVVEDGAGALNTPPTSLVSGNVLTNDVHPNGLPGADTPTSFVAWGAGDAAVIAQLSTYGTLVQNANGTWSYTLNNGLAATQALDSTFSQNFVLNYTMQDADGDQDTATLTITINGANDGPTVTVNQGNGGANDQVLEAGLNGSGSAAAGNGEFAGGTFTLADADGLADLQSVTITGVGAPVVFTIAQLTGATPGLPLTVLGDHGTLRITGYAAGVATYTYELTEATTDLAGIEQDSFTVTVTDGTTTSAPAAITIDIIDDVPNAVNDGAYVVVEDGAGALNTPPTSLVSGNVLTNDVHPNGLPGADTPTSFVAWGAGDAAVIAQLSTYGTLVQNANGTWSYTLNNGLAATQALDSTFSQNFVLNYTMQDADGDQDTATLTITINGANDGPTVTVNQGNGGANDQVLEAGLNGSGSAAAGNGEFAGGTFTLADADGLADLQSVTITGVGAPVVFTIAQLTGATPGLPLTVLGDHGTLRITGYAAGVATYTYELTEATTDLAGIEQDSFTVTVTDGTTTSAPAAITIDIIDDVPNAVNDGAYVVVEDGAGALNTPPTSLVSGNVLTNDVHPNGLPGADTPTSFVAWGAGDAAVIAQLSTYGTLVQNANGTWSYTLNNGLAATQALDSTFSQNFVLNYTMQDADGDQDTATLTITINGANDGPTVTVNQGNGGANDQVLEAGLNGSGSAAAGNGEFAGGTFTLADADGLADLQSVTITGVGAPVVFTIAQLTGATPGLPLTVLGDHGTLRITGYAAGVATYTYELTEATTDLAGIEQDSFTVTVTDGTTTSAPAAITIDIIDDVPNAVNDGAYVVVEDGAGALNTPPTSLVSGNVLTNDVHPNGLPGADTPTSFVAWGAGDAAVIAQLSTYGTLVQNANGTWSYTLNNGLAATQALDSTFSQNFVLNYTMQDADGDQDTATLTITINGANDGPTVTVNQGNGGANDQVLEAGLNGSGSAAAGNGEFAGGTFTLADADGLADLQSVTITGVGAPVVFTIAQLTGATPGLPLTVLGDHGTLRITGYAAGVATYTYELTEATTDLAGIEQDSFTVTVTDGTTTSAPAAITIDIIDDVPNAVNDGAYVVVEDGAGALNTPPTSLVSGNVLTNDVHPNGLPGADTPTSFVAWGAGDAAVIAQLSTYGTLVQNANGTWSYTLNNGLAATQALDSTFSQNFVLNYTMQDADGDQDTATLTITINGANDGPVVANTHNWMSSDPGQQTLGSPTYPNGYPLLVSIPTDADGDNLVVTATGIIPSGIFYFNGTTYAALTAGTVLYNSASNINLLDDIVYRPTAAAVDTVNVNLSLDVFDGDSHVSQIVSIHEVPPTSLPSNTAQVGNGNSPLTSGNDQTQTMILSQATVNAILADAHTATVVVYTDFQEQPNSAPVPVGERDPGAFGDASAGSHREQEVQVEIRIGSNRFVVVEDDLTAGTFEKSWDYDATSGLMKATVDYDHIFLLDGLGNKTTTTLADYLIANPPAAGNSWTLSYFDNNGGNWQARSVSFEFFAHDPGDPGITVNGHATLADQIFGTSGRDNLSGNGGNDIIIGRGGADTINLGAGSDTAVVNVSVGSSSDSARVANAGNANDAGQDTIAGFDLSNDTIQIVAAGVSSFAHGANTAVGTAGADNTGLASSFTTATGLVSLNGDSDFADVGDVATTFAAPSVALTEANFEARLQYVLIGTSGADIISGGALNDTLNGGLGIDQLSGAGGNDMLAGGTGQDSLSGGSGADTFVIGEMDASDFIADYDFGQGDKIDISNLLDAVYGTGEHDAQVGNVSLEVSGSNVNVMFDVDGGGAGAAVSVATLVNYSTAGIDSVKIIFDDNSEATQAI